ncbi:MAG TPA: helix-turn-helix domain-containing protein [Rhodoferax sp.]
MLRLAVTRAQGWIWRALNKPRIGNWGDVFQLRDVECNLNCHQVCPDSGVHFSDRWTLLVFRDLMSGKSQFKEFLASPEGIATNILAERLTRLTDYGLVERYVSSQTAGREAYRLTERGRSLRSILVQVKNWGLQHIDGTETRLELQL